MSPTEPVRSARLVLNPLVPADAADMVAVLADPDLYRFTGGAPPTLDELADVYRHQASGCPGGGEAWHNWIVRLGGTAIGYVQATVRGNSANLAWVVGTPWQGSGYATEASTAMRDWLADQGVTEFSAHIHPDHAASAVIATKLELRPTGRLDDEGELIWATGTADEAHDVRSPQ